MFGKRVGSLAKNTFKPRIATWILVLERILWNRLLLTECFTFVNALLYAHDQILISFATAGLNCERAIARALSSPESGPAQFSETSHPACWVRTRMLWEQIRNYCSFFIKVGQTGKWASPVPPKILNYKDEEVDCSKYHPVKSRHSW